jgi:hypothetical protein
VAFSGEHTLVSAIRARQEGMLLRGADKGAGSFISSMVGYSGLTTSLWKSIIRGVSLTLGVLSSEKEVDVVLETPGHLSVIYSSLMKHAKDKDWKLYLEHRHAASADIRYADRVITDFRPSVHRVIYSPVGMRSHSLGNNEFTREINVNLFERDSSFWKPHNCEKYTIYAPLFGYFPWAKPLTKDDDSKLVADDNNGRSFVPKVFPKSPQFVYKFGHADQFCGVVSTVKGLLYGGFQYDDIKNALTRADVTPVCITDPATWYRHVIANNVAREMWWALGSPQYSAVSNVVWIPRSGVRLMTNDLGDLEIVTDDYRIDVPEESSQMYKAAMLSIDGQISVPEKDVSTTEARITTTTAGSFGPDKPVLDPFSPDFASVQLPSSSQGSTADLTNM